MQQHHLPGDLVDALEDKDSQLGRTGQSMVGLPVGVCWRSPEGTLVVLVIGRSPEWFKLAMLIGPHLENDQISPVSGSMDTTYLSSFKDGP